MALEMGNEVCPYRVFEVDDGIRTLLAEFIFRTDAELFLSCRVNAKPVGVETLQDLTQEIIESAKLLHAAAPQGQPGFPFGPGNSFATAIEQAIKLKQLHYAITKPQEPCNTLGRAEQ